MLRFADLIDKHNDELGALETWDNGKPYEQAAKVEVPMVSRLMRYYAGRLHLSVLCRKHQRYHGLTLLIDHQNLVCSFRMGRQDTWADCPSGWASPCAGFA